MKKIRKILIIFSLSFYLTSILTPQKDEEAHAIGLTASIVLGSMAVLGMGGVIAHHNSSYIQQVGEKVGAKMEATGANISDMFARNQYGVNQNLLNSMAESMNEINGTFSKGIYSAGISSVAGGAFQTWTLPAGITSAYDPAVDRLKVKFIHRALTYPDKNYKGTLRMMSSTNDSYGFRLTQTGSILDLVSTDLSHTTWLLARGAHVAGLIIQNGVIGVNMQSVDKEEYFDIGVEVEVIDPVQHAIITNGSTDIPVFNTTEDYYNTISNNYSNTQALEIDYNQLENVLNNASSEPVTLTNMDTLITKIENIGDGIDDNTNILTTIWNGIKGIPSLIQSSSTAVLGGISTLTDDLLSGLGNFTDNITKANEQLWEDAGAVWSGMTSAIEKAGTDTRESVTTALTGIDELLIDMGSTLRDIPSTIRTGIETGLTGLNDTVADLSSTVRTIPGAISTSVTDAFTSALTVPDGYITDRVTTIHEIITPKLPRFPTKEAIFPSDFDEMGDWQGISVNFNHYGIGEQMVIDNEAPNYYRRQIKLWISAILYFFTALFVIRKVAGVINK